MSPARMSHGLRPVAWLVLLGCTEPAPVATKTDVGSATTGDTTGDTTSDTGADPWQHGQSAIAGTAYRFGFEPGPIAGAKVLVAELPQLATTTSADGRWALAVPRNWPVTPAIALPDHATMHLQTFTFTDAEGPRNVNFQTVPQPYFDAFAAVLGLSADPTLCQIASTVNTKDVFALDRKAFYKYGAHGIAGATVSAAPDLGPPV